MKTVSPLLLCLVLGACVAQPAPPPTEPDLTTEARSALSRAIVVPSKDTAGGIAWEYAWIRKNRPGWEPAGQALLEDQGRYYDLITLTKDGNTEDVLFDITGFFGK
jgi:hypothetical protein